MTVPDMTVPNTARVDATDATEALYLRHGDELMRFATSLVGPSDAADLVSVAFVGAMSSGTLATAEHPRAYLYRCVLNAARSNARSGGRRRLREDRDAALQPTTTSGPDTDPEVWAALGKLSERQRAVVYLTYWMDLAPTAIAELLDLSTGSVKKHLDRGRAALRTTLGDLR